MPKYKRFKLQRRQNAQKMHRILLARKTTLPTSQQNDDDSVQRNLLKKEAQATVQGGQDGQAASTSALAQDNNEVPNKDEQGPSTSSQDPDNVCDLQMTVDEEVDEKKPRVKKPRLPKHLRDNQVLLDRPQRITKIHAEQLIKDIAKNKPQYRAPPVLPLVPPPPPVQHFPPPLFDVLKEVKPRIKKPRQTWSQLNCSECSRRLKERMFRCVQCPHVLLCGICERRAHPDHCVLRLPSRGIYEKVKDLFETLKREFDDILPNKDDEDDNDDDGLMADVEEQEIEYNPMGINNSVQVELIPVQKQTDRKPASTSIIQEYPVLSLPDRATDVQIIKPTLASGLQLTQKPPTLQYMPSLVQNTQQYMPSLVQNTQQYMPSLVQNTQQFTPTLVQGTSAQPIAQGPMRTLQIMPMSFQITPLDPLAPTFEEKPIVNVEENVAQRMGGRDAVNIAMEDDLDIKREPEEYVVLDEMPEVKNEPPDPIIAQDAGDGTTSMESKE